LAFLGLSATVIGARWVAQRDAEELRMETQAEAKHVAAQLTVGLEQAFDNLDRVSAWWLLQGRPMTPDDWTTDARLFTTSQAGLRRLIWLDTSGTPMWSSRPGSAPDRRRDIPSAPAMITACRAARELQDTAISPAGAATFICSPAFHEGRLRGYIAGQYDTDRLARSVLEEQLPGAYAVATTFGTHATTISGQIDTDHVQRAKADIGGDAWWVALSPLKPGPTPLRQAILIFGVATSALMFISASAARVAHRRAHQVVQLNRDLQRRLDEFRTLIEVLPIGIAVAEDPECRHIWTNRTLASMLGMRYGDRGSHSAPGGENPPPYRMLRDGIDVPIEELPMQTAARTGAPARDVFLDIVCADGKVLRTLSYAAPLFDERGRVRGVINACVDITSRRELEARLQQAEKYQSLALMAGGIAHDFNNLLTVIIGNVAAATPQLPAGTNLTRSLEEVQAAALRAADLVGKLLAYTGRFWRELTPIVLSNEIEAAAPELREMIPPNVSLRFQLEPDLPPVEAGAEELRQVLRHLTTNAIEALEGVEEGNIAISVTRRNLSAAEIEERFPDRKLRPGTYVRLEVRDNGCGIPENIRARVFDPFFTTKFVGRGLGLSAVQGIVQAQGGAVRLESSEEGTLVEVVLPACESSVVA
jgi:signal transduction histidine kinase